MKVSKDEVAAFDLYFAHAYGAEVARRSTASNGPLGGIAAAGHPVGRAAEVALSMLEKRRELIEGSDS